jgi:hypothetical protein
VTNKPVLPREECQGRKDNLCMSEKGGQGSQNRNPSLGFNGRHGNVPRGVLGNPHGDRASDTAIYSSIMCSKTWALAGNALLFHESPAPGPGDREAEFGC